MLNQDLTLALTVFARKHALAELSRQDPASTSSDDHREHSPVIVPITATILVRPARQFVALLNALRWVGERFASPVGPMTVETGSGFRPGRPQTGDESCARCR